MRCVEPASELLFDLFPGRFLVGCAVNRPHLRHRPWSLNNFQQYIALLNILTTSTNWVSHFWLEIWMMWTLSSLLLERCVLWGERGWRPIVRKEFLLNSTAERIRTPASLLAKPSAVALVVGPFIHFARTISRNVCWRHCKWVETVAGWAQFRIKRDADKCKKRKECKNWRIKNAKREPGFFLFFFFGNTRKEYQSNGGRPPRSGDNLWSLPVVHNVGNQWPINQKVNQRVVRPWLHPTAIAPECACAATGPRLIARYLPVSEWWNGARNRILIARHRAGNSTLPFSILRSSAPSFDQM